MISILFTVHGHIGNGVRFSVGYTWEIILNMSVKRHGCISRSGSKIFMGRRVRGSVQHISAGGKNGDAKKCKIGVGLGGGGAADHPASVPPQDRPGRHPLRPLNTPQVRVNGGEFPPCMTWHPIPSHVISSQGERHNIYTLVSVLWRSSYLNTVLDLHHFIYGAQNLLATFKIVI